MKIMRFLNIYIECDSHSDNFIYLIKIKEKQKQKQKVTVRLSSR